MKWEYWNVDFPDAATQDWGRYMDNLGESGWELIACLPVNERKMFRMIFKRPLEQKAVTS